MTDQPLLAAIAIEATWREAYDTVITWLGGIILAGSVVLTGAAAVVARRTGKKTREVSDRWFANLGGAVLVLFQTLLALLLLGALCLVGLAVFKWAWSVVFG
jgi:hypothetical protein